MCEWCIRCPKQKFDRRIEFGRMPKCFMNCFYFQKFIPNHISWGFNLCVAFYRFIYIFFNDPNLLEASETQCAEIFLFICLIHQNKHWLKEIISEARVAQSEWTQYAHTLNLFDVSKHFLPLNLRTIYNLLHFGRQYSTWPRIKCTIHNFALPILSASSHAMPRLPIMCGTERASVHWHRNRLARPEICSSAKLEFAVAK